VDDKALNDFIGIFEPADFRSGDKFKHGSSSRRVAM